MVLVAPSGLAKVSSSEGGDASTVMPAVGVDETSELSAASTRATPKAPTAMMPAKMARAKAAEARQMARAGGEVLFMQVAQR